MIMSEKNCYTKDEIMLMIANTFVVYVYHIENNGLVDGKTGAMLFLYRYAALSGNEEYEALAGQLLDGMMKVAPSLPHGFESGLAGVGWAISRLIREGLVEGKPDNVLRAIDERVLGRMECDRRSILGQAVYMAERLRNTTPEYGLERYAGRILDFIQSELTCAKECPTLYHLNSALYFLSCVRHLTETRGSAEKLIGVLPSVYDRIKKESAFTEQDIFINRLLSEKTGTEAVFSADDVNDKNVLYGGNAGDDADLRGFVNKAWQELVYFGRLVSVLPSQDRLSAFVDRMQTDLSEDSMSMRHGLAGLGLALTADEAASIQECGTGCV